MRDAQSSTNKIKKILVVDDERTITTIFEHSLKHFGYNVHVYNVPENAVKYFSQHKDLVDCVITDLQMPKMDGITFAHEIKKENPTIPIIMCTGCSDDMLDGMDMSDINVILHKPVSFNDLTTTVRSYAA